MITMTENDESSTKRESIKHKDGEVIKPCLELEYCPYGYLVEGYPIMDDKFSCGIFRHDCPVFYTAAEGFIDDDKPEEDEITKKDSEEYFNDLREYILDNWKVKGMITNEENTRFNIETITYLLCNYRLPCLLSTILDIEDLWEKFDKE